MPHPRYTTEPWSHASVLLQLPGFCIEMITIDLMHVFHLGVCRDLCGTVIKLIIKRKDIFNGRNIETRFKQATASLKQFCKAP